MSDFAPVPVSKGCQQALRLAGKAYPRTCAECGLGPCKFYRAEKPATPNNRNDSVPFPGMVGAFEAHCGILTGTKEAAPVATPAP